MDKIHKILAYPYSYPWNFKSTDISMDLFLNMVKNGAKDIITAI